MNVPPVGSTAPASPQSQPENIALGSFLAKVSVGGDLASECLALFAKDAAVQNRVNLQGVNIQSRQVREARTRRMKLLKKFWAAQRHQGFWSKLAGFFKKLTGALSAALIVVGGPAAAVGVVGGALSGGFSITASVYGRNATCAWGDKLAAEQVRDLSSQTRDDLLSVLDSAAQLEGEMHDRIRGLLESESEMVSC
ncbi:MAG TPA: hypothetical protein VM425_18945 [Myxococcota bacterium]|nr:hypothetical protein [Myxococcota bacterium]